MNGLLRTLFFVSAIAPAVLISALLQLWNLGPNMTIAGWIAASTFACLFPLLVMIAAAQRVAVMPFSAKKVEPQDWMLVVFVVSYFLPLVINVKDLHIFVGVVLVAAVILATLDAIPSHPVLHVFRYRFYKAEGTNGVVYTLITRRRLLTASDVKSVKQLTPNLVLEA
ncbi:hypothetical protein ACN9MY_06255 [Pseudoduganella sp. R-31]|uniref:hypothetical protein n=1 Tax=Pseudoduganella sp. R-31 TaxID=3404060 RepID=UPI003CF5A9E5